jgi:hypothetical protein
MRSTKTGKATLDESESKLTATELYMPNFCWVGAPKSLTFAESKRGKIPATGKRKPEKPAPPTRPNPMLEATAARAKKHKPTAISSPSAPKKPAKTTAISSPSAPAKPPKKSAISSPSAPPVLAATASKSPASNKKKKAAAPLEEVPEHVHRFSVGDDVNIVNKEILASGRILDLEPYIKLPEEYQGEAGEEFIFHAVKLLQVFACAKQGGKKKDKPITFNAGDIFPRPDDEMQWSVSDVPTDEADLQLHNYFEKVDGRSDEILIWEKFLQAPETTKPSSKSKPAAKGKTPALQRGSKPSSAAAPGEGGSRPRLRTR